MVARYYRAIFVDLKKVAASVSNRIPAHSHVLDIGGGDGEPLNHILSLRPDIRVTMIDVTSSVGSAIRKEFVQRVTRWPGTSIRAFLDRSSIFPEAVLISDVVHHVPLKMREAFFRDIAELTRRSPSTVVIIKDVEPGTFRASLSYLADRYITGDRNVALISRMELKELIMKVWGSVVWSETDLFTRDRPNYAVAFSAKQDLDVSPLS